MTVQDKLLTIEEFARLPNDGKKYDLVKGHLVEVCRPKFIHGRLQSRFARFLDTYADANRLGAVVTESGHILSRNPDTVRGRPIRNRPGSSRLALISRLRSCRRTTPSKT